MTREDIIRMYEKANGWSPEGWDKTVDELERFAALVAAEIMPKEALSEMFEWGKDAGRREEREACAKVAERFEPIEKQGYVEYASTAIRARRDQ